ncbi:MAG TPA: hypothetical protein VJ876_04980 [Bacteroidales bacterium]|nr:hypothetical protein [Bacteroidales bacterium]
MICSCFTAGAQEVNHRLKEANQAYAGGRLQDSRMALQQALAEVDQVLGREILAMLPEAMESMPFDAAEDQVVGNAAGITGLHINRSYRKEEQLVAVELIDDSPLLAAVNSLLSLPSFLGTADPNKKRIKIHGYKALLEKNVDDSTGLVAYNLQVPFNRSLFTFRSNGFDDEQQVLKMAETVPLEAIVKMTR